MDLHEQQEQELAIIASFKDNGDVEDIADISCSNEDSDEDGYWGIRDGIEAALPNGKDVWAVQYYEPGKTESEFETGLFFFFIDKSFENVKKKIEALPNLLTKEEFEALIPQIRAVVPTAGKINNLAIESTRAILIEVPSWHSSMPKEFKGVKLRYSVKMPKTKKLKKNK